MVAVWRWTLVVGKVREVRSSIIVRVRNRKGMLIGLKGFFILV